MQEGLDGPRERSRAWYLPGPRSCPGQATNRSRLRLASPGATLARLNADGMQRYPR